MTYETRLVIKTVDNEIDSVLAHLETHSRCHLSDRQERRTCQWGNVNRETVRFERD